MTETDQADAAAGQAAPEPSWTPPGATGRKAMLDAAKSIAIVGASSNPARASNFVMTYLKSSICDYDLYPVNPRESEILGLQCYPSLDALPVVPDIVDVFRKPDDCPAIATEAVAIGAKVLWLQLGIESPEAAAIATAVSTPKYSVGTKLDSASTAKPMITVTLVK